MAPFLHYVEEGVFVSLGDPVGGFGRAEQVVPSLHHINRYLFNGGYPFEDPVFFGEEAIMHKVMSLNPCDGDRIGLLDRLFDYFRIVAEPDAGELPGGPADGCFKDDSRVIGGESSVVGGKEVAPFRFRG